jgi:hypothetical protein
MLLVDDLLFGLPAKGLTSIFTKVCEMAQLELTDDAKVKDELLQLQTLYEIDEITEEEYQEKEAVLLERLMAAEGV